MVELVPPQPLPVSPFQQLQAALEYCWQGTESFAADQPGISATQERVILVVPSLSLDQGELNKIAGYTHYEERQLFSLIQLRNPRTRMIFITSSPLHPSIVDYYLDLLPGIPSAHARERLLLLSTYDQSTQPLSAKILARPRLLQRIRQALRPGASYMVCYNSTDLERQLALALNLPLFAVDPDLLYWGTKAGSRQLFAEAGLPHPDGCEQVHSIPDLAAATVELWQRQPNLQQVMIKLNEGFSGEGNALLNLAPIAEVSSQTFEQRVATVTAHFAQLRFQAPCETWNMFSQRIPKLGAIVEAYLPGAEKRSPSVQGRISPSGQVEIISTHDQILGGPDRQIFQGCRFPADAAYRLQLQELGQRVGQHLAAKGAIGHYGVDFLCRPQPGTLTGWDIQAIEINLRKGGTTHPFMTLKFLTNGDYDPGSGLFYSQHGRPKYYIASDNLQCPQYQGLMPNDLLDIITCYQLHFDSSTETGTVFHLMGALSEFGKLGLTSVGDSAAEADALYEQAVTILDRETGAIDQAHHLNGYGAS
jgi:PGM1 C-terminal domain